MRTIKNSVLFFILATILLAGCDKVSYRKTTGGMPYQLYRGKGSQKAVPGNIVKAQYSYKVKDSIYFSSFGMMPDYIPVNPTSQPYDISEIWTLLHEGDSIITTQMIDTFIKRNPANVPPNFQKGDRIVTKLKVLAIFTSDSAAKLDEERERKAYLTAEIDYLGKYLAGKNIKADKTPSGAFVQIINPGTGDAVDSGKYVTVNYTGTTLSGKKFDSNTDTSFHHAEPYGFTVNAGQMIKGFDEATMFLKQGGSAMVYVPSMLGYGGRPNPASGIKPYEHLVFDLSIVSVQDSAPVPEMGPQRPQKVDVHQSNK